MKKIKENRGITLIALVVTIVVLLILAGVSISMLIGNNGIITNAKLAKVSTEFASYKEEVELYKTDKFLKNNDFKEDTLTAGKTTITYEGKPEEETGNITTVIQSLDEKYLSKFIIINGKLYLMATSEVSNIEIKAAQNTGIEVMPYEISETGELLSSNVNLGLQGTNGTLIIPEIVTSIGHGAFSGVEGLKKVVLPPSVTKIGDYAFTNNKELEEVEIQGNLISIGEYAFDGANNLAKINLPDSTNYIGRVAFQSTNLDNIVIPKDVKWIGNMAFANCANLNSVTLQEGLIEIGDNAFTNTKISKLTFPSTLKTIEGSAFKGCKNLYEFDLSNNQNFEYEKGMLIANNNIIFISYKAIQNLTTIEIPDGIKTFASDISNNSNIKNIIISASLESINMMYLPSSIENIEVKAGNNIYTSENGIIYNKNNNSLVGCYSKEKNITIPEGIKTLESYSFKQAINAEIINLPDSLETIGADTFRGGENTKIKEINIGKNVSDISPRFKRRHYQGNVNIDSENKYYKVENNILYKKDEKGDPTILVCVLYEINGTMQIPSTVKELGDYSFYGQRKMTEIIVSEGVETIGLAFCYCSILKKVEIPSTVKTITDGCFADATNELEEIIIHNKNGSILGAPWGAVKGMRAVKWEE